MDCAIELLREKFSEWIENPNVVSFSIEFPTDVDTMVRPSKDFVKSKLQTINEISDLGEINKIEREIYKVFRAYSPEWDDDELANCLSYAETGELFEYVENIDECCDYLVGELDKYI